MEVSSPVARCPPDSATESNGLNLHVRRADMGPIYWGVTGAPTSWSLAARITVSASITWELRIDSKHPDGLS